MKEVSYQIFDSVSGLPIHSLSNRYIREMADRANKSYFEFFNYLKLEVKKFGVEYFIKLDSNIIIPTIKGSGFKSPGKYFSKYEDAINYNEKENKNEKSKN